MLSSIGTSGHHMTDIYPFVSKKDYLLVRKFHPINLLSPTVARSTVMNGRIPIMTYHYIGLKILTLGSMHPGKEMMLVL